MERYCNAFEAGQLPEGRFAKRIEALEQRLTDLRARRQALQEAEADHPEVPTAAVIRETAMAITEAMSRGTLQQRKALLQQLVAGVEVNSREEIVPTFRIHGDHGSRYGSSGGPRLTAVEPVNGT